MGYTTEFKGSFTLTPALTEAQVAYLNAFSGSRRVQRDAEACETINDEIRAAVGLPVGKEGSYCVYSAQDGNYGQNSDKTVINNNEPPEGQPGLWCQWVPNETGDKLKWDGGEKFYYYEEWLHYINENFLKPWGIVIDGTVKWQGEEMDDRGEIEADEGVITSRTLE